MAQESAPIRPLSHEPSGSVPESTPDGSERSQKRPPHSCRCGSRWWGELIAHCPTCHRTFTRPSNFDRHRRDGVCLDPASVGLVPNGRRDADVGSGGVVWSLPAQPRPEPEPERDWGPDAF